VDGASRVALRLGLTPLVIGLTVVAFGTSAPEASVTVGSALAGRGDLALGNVVGSNIFNVLFILGLCALIAPLRIAQRLLWIDVPLLVVVSLLLLVLALDRVVGRFDGALLLGCLLAYTYFAIEASRREPAEIADEYTEEFASRGAGPPRLPAALARVVAGLALLVVGARVTVYGAVEIASQLGLSDLVVGLTIVAAGTSLPEVATSVVATRRGEPDIAVGNVIGSNLFNVLGVLGLGALVSRPGIPVATGALDFDIPVMIATAFACLPVFLAGHEIPRWVGGLFVAYYAAYSGYVVLLAQEHDALPAFSAVMLEFVLPLTGVSLVLALARGMRTRA
jgi:cation:H+ antiporter